MKKISACCCFLTALVLLLPACSLFREVTEKKKTANIPPPTEEAKPLPKEKPAGKPAPPPFNVPAFAKVVRKPVYNIALFTPLYLDQVVDTAFAVNSSQPLPRYALSGLEFYEGSLMALDSLREEGVPLRLFLYDTKSSTWPLSQRLRQMGDSTDLIIASVNADELKLLSDFAKQKQINFISATYPNDAGISDNPFLTIVNSTLRTHCFAIQNFAQEKFYNQQILVLRRDNPQEKRNTEYIQEAYRDMQLSRKVPIKVMEWDDSTKQEQLAAHLLPGKNNVIIVTALYPDTAESIIRQLATMSADYTINVIGMPTLDGQKDLLGYAFKGINIYYSTPYFSMRTDPASRRFMWRYFEQYHAKPSDMAFKGFETLFYFGHLLHADGLYFNKDMNYAIGRFVTDYHFEPVYQAGENAKPDYFENKHLYFIQVRDSVISRAN